MNAPNAADLVIHAFLAGDLEDAITDDHASTLPPPRPAPRLVLEDRERVEAYLVALRAMRDAPAGPEKQRAIRRAEAAFYVLAGPAVTEGLRRARAEGLL